MVFVGTDMIFVGLDLAWSPRNRSGGAVLRASGRVEAASASLGSDDEVCDFVTNDFQPRS